MIKESDIKPDFQKLQKYLYEEVAFRVLIGIKDNISIASHFYQHFQEKNPEFNSCKFQELLTEYNLDKNLSDLYVFAGYYSEKWIICDNIVRNWDNEFNINSYYCMWTQALNELNELKFFLANNECNKVKLISTKDQVTLTSQILLELLGCEIQKFAKKVRKEYELERRAYYEEVFRTIGIMLSPKKQSYKKIFFKTLSQLYNYLKNETYYKDEEYQDTDIYGFIEKICLIIGCEETPIELRKYIK